MIDFLLNMFYVCLGLILAVIAICIVYVIVTAVRIAIMEIRYERNKKNE